MTAATRTPEGYKKALAELDAILKELEAEEVDVDGLESKVEKAAGLLKFCKERLDATELKVKAIIGTLAESEGESPG
jgi:exodeoxyribonuclease VII small subunit